MVALIVLVPHFARASVHSKVHSLVKKIDWVTLHILPMGQSD